MLKNQTVNHVSEHLSAICPVYTKKGGVRERSDRGGGLKESNTPSLRDAPSEEGVLRIRNPLIHHFLNPLADLRELVVHFPVRKPEHQ